MFQHTKVMQFVCGRSEMLHAAHQSNVVCVQPLTGLSEMISAHQNNVVCVWAQRGVSAHQSNAVCVWAQKDVSAHQRVILPACCRGPLAGLCDLSVPDLHMHVAGHPANQRHNGQHIYPLR